MSLYDTFSQSKSSNSVNDNSDSDTPEASGSVYDAFKNSDASKNDASKSVYNTFKDRASSKTSSKLFSKNEPSGASIGFSDQKDTSGKPYLAYRNSGDNATTTDVTRVATSFDPTTPQKIDSKSFYNPRGIANRAALKSAMGGTYSDELDHIISLELSGSNNPKNLQIEPDIAGSKNTATDPLETSLARDVAAGKISLFEAQTKLAKTKGKDAPWTPPEYKSSSSSGTWDHVKDYLLDLMGVGKAHAETKDESLHDQFVTDQRTQRATQASSTDPFEQKAIDLKTEADAIQAQEASLKQEKGTIDSSDPRAVSGYNAKAYALQQRVNAFNSGLADINKEAETRNIAARKEFASAYATAGGTTIGPASNDTSEYDQGIYDKLKDLFIPTEKLETPSATENTPYTGGFEKGIREGLLNVSQQINKTVGDIIGFVQQFNPDSPHQDPTDVASQALGKTISLAGDAVGIAWSPVGGTLKGAESVPVVGPIAQFVNGVFGKISAIASSKAGDLLNAAPLPDHIKDDLRGPVEELAGLASQYLTGKLAHETGIDASERLNDIRESIAEKTANSLPLDSTEQAVKRISELQGVIKDKITQGLQDLHMTLQTMPNAQGGFIKVPFGKSEDMPVEATEENKPTPHEEALQYTNLPDFIKDKQEEKSPQSKEELTTIYNEAHKAHADALEFKEAAADMNVINQEHSMKLSDLEERGRQLEIEREALNNDPARGLAPYVAKSGEFKGRLPEVTGKSGSRFGRKGDQIITELGFTDSEQARDAWEKYSKRKEAFESKVKAFKDEHKQLTLSFKEDVDKYGGEKGRNLEKYNPDILKNNGGIAPIISRGNALETPEVDWTNVKDIAQVRLSRDTMERNIEKTAGPYVKALKDYVVEPVRENEMERVNYANDIRIRTRGKLKEWGIKRGTDEDELIQKYGEGLVSLTELQKLTPKWAEVSKATGYFRTLYDELIDKWNLERQKFGYPPVPKRGDYFRHFNDINQWTNSFGFLVKDSQLPTAIAGITETFTPGKAFSTAELHRTGNNTSYSAIGGMDNYLDSVTKQMYHIDSIQRGRTLEKYIRQSATKNKAISLPNFVSNLHQYTDMIAGKVASLDRSIESIAGRPFLKILTKVSNLIGRNIIAGNISVAMTHLVSLPLNLATVDKVPFIRGMYKTLMSPLLAEDFTSIDGVQSSFLTRRYPEKNILPSKFDSSQQVLGWLFEMTDHFKTKLAVASKFYEGISQGLSKEQAMKAADNYAGRIVGDYSVGNKPAMMNSGALKLFAQFQLGVNDGLSVLMHDIPQWEKGNKSKIAGRLLQFAVFSYFFNQFYKQIRGSGKGLDPIDALLTTFGLNEEGSGHDLVTRLGMAGSDIAGELPFTSAAFGSFPLATAVGQPIYNVITGNNRGAAAESLASNIVSPIGGGGQVKKTIEGIQAYNAGQTTTAGGKTRQIIQKTPINLIKGIVFGPSGFSDVKDQNAETTKLLGLVSSTNSEISKEAESLYQQYKALPSDQATKAWKDLQAKDKPLAERISQIAKDDKNDVTLNERLTRQLGVTNGQRAHYIFDQFNKLSDKQAKSDLWKRYVTLKIITPQVSKQILYLLKNK